jgi:glutamate 5-kinase
MSLLYRDFVKSLNNVERFVVKVGTSSITDDNNKLDVGKIATLVSILMKERIKGKIPILVSSGAIGAGLGKMRLTQRPTDIEELQAAAAIGQGILMQTYEVFFNHYDQPIAQLLLTKDDFTNKYRYRNLSNTLEKLIQWNVIPIINENDTVATEEIKVGDNDTLASYVAQAVDSKLLIIFTDVDGLYTGNPKNPKSTFIKTVEKVTEDIEGWASSVGRGFGGMYTKVQAAKILAEKNIATIIANHNSINALEKALNREIGTLFLPRGFTQ